MANFQLDLASLPQEWRRRQTAAQVLLGAQTLSNEEGEVAVTSAFSSLYELEAVLEVTPCDLDGAAAKLEAGLLHAEVQGVASDPAWQMIRSALADLTKHLRMSSGG